MSRIAIASMFRNATTYIPRYAEQMAGLTGHLTGLGYDIHLIAAEGDSSDDTFAMLDSRLSYLYDRIAFVKKNSKKTLIKAAHGGPVFVSADDNVVRWRNISWVCDQILAAVTPEDDYLLYVESDLVWSTETMDGLLQTLMTRNLDAVAPICIHMPTGLCYDIWGHRKDGIKFRAHKPYHPALVDGEITEIDSADSCIAMRGEVARNCRFNPPELGIVGFGQDIHAKGYQLWLDADLHVYHP